MKILNVLLIGCLSASLFTGCAVKSGNEKLDDIDRESIVGMIKNNYSTKAEVRKNFGEPTDITFKDSGLEEWKYTHARKVQKGINYVPVVNWFVSGTNDKKKTLIVLFDGDTVKNHSYSEADDETYGGLVR